MRIKYANGRISEVATIAAAEAELRRQYPDAVFCDHWEDSGEDSHGRAMERQLVWENEEEAGPEGTGDDGSHAVAEIVRRV